MLKALLIDDEPFALKELQYHLDNFHDIEVVGAFTDPFKGFAMVEALIPDVVFLDIEMPEAGGIYIAEQIVSSFPETSIIFVTAYNQYAINAFELNAVDYLLKPISQERLAGSIARIKKYSSVGEGEKIHQLSQQYEESVKKFFVYEGESTVLLPLEEICYIEASNKCVHIRTADKRYHSRHMLKYYESKLKNLNFYRVHRSYIVNLAKITRITPKINYYFDIQFQGIEESVPVSRNTVKHLRKLLEL
jgi:DNA-binding LytR/AlgR family response regulator